MIVLKHPLPKCPNTIWKRETWYPLKQTPMRRARERMSITPCDFRRGTLAGYFPELNPLVLLC